MNRFTRLIAYSILVSAPLMVSAQGNPGGMQRGGMTNQEQMQWMHENMLQMQELRQKMHNAESYNERERLRGEHIEHMHQHMGMMRGDMMGQGQNMMGQGQGMMRNGQSRNDDQGSAPSGRPQQPRGGGDMSVEQRMERMESRMDQMQFMMEQMLGYMEGNRRQR